MSVEEIGCCGAYCGTCIAYKNPCLGCKIGYSNGERNLKKAKCKMKVCCVSKEYNSCAECNEYETCHVLNEFYNKNGYKYSKYKQASQFIKKNGNDKFIEVAEKWKCAFGKYDK